jgi:hypothetical protein
VGWQLGECEPQLLCDCVGSSCNSLHGFVIEPCPHRDRGYGIGSNFGKFYLIRTDVTLGEPVSLVKVFRLFRLEGILFWCLECVCGHSSR